MKKKEKERKGQKWENRWGEQVLFNKNLDLDKNWKDQEKMRWAWDLTLKISDNKVAVL